MATALILHPGAMGRTVGAAGASALSRARRLATLLPVGALLACASDRRLPNATESARAAAMPAAPVPAGVSACGTATALASGVSEQRLTSGGVERRFLVHLPARYDGRAALPVVFELHGSGGSPEGQLATSQLQALADTERFAIVLPASLGERWNVPPDPAKQDDVRFIADALDAVGRLFCVDARQVFATGFSGGGRMSSQLACDLSGRIAAIAAIGGIRFPGPCNEARNMPILAFHGTADPTNPYVGGGQPYWGASVESAIDGWASHNGCGARGESHVAPSVAKLAYGGGGCADVVLYRIDGFGHAWPGVIYPDRKNGSANALLWSFFQDHPLPSTQLPSTQ
jgi:polyhydroxybutyrate depolymerase